MTPATAQFRYLGIGIVDVSEHDRVGRARGLTGRHDIAVAKVAIVLVGRDVRRLRPNILVGGVDGLAERQWPGAELYVGEAIVRLDSLRSRCHMTTIDPDSLQVNPDVLRDIVRRFDNKLALNAEVVRGGTLRVGDPVRLSVNGSQTVCFR